MLIKQVSKVDKLTRRVEDFYDQKQADELRSERQLAALKTIRQAPNWTKMDFWCKKHRQDTTGIAYKVTFKSFGEWKAYYQSCTTGFPKDMRACCKGLRRNITDKHWDKYYTDSAMIRQQVGAALANGDLLQPGQEGFITKYGDPNKKKWAEMEKQERDSWQKQIKISL